MISEPRKFNSGISGISVILDIAVIMKTSKQILPGIKSIGWVECQRLPRRVDLNGICGIAVSVLADVHPLEFFGEPTCECKTVRDGAAQQDTVTLKFNSSQTIPHGAVPAFVVEDVNGKSWLIGSRECPRPVVEYEKISGTASGDSAGYAYEVRHTAIKSLVPCVVMMK